MDPLTQGLLGAALPQAVAKPEAMRRATLAGALGGMAPDLDTLIRSSADPLLAIEYHRHFTHSLAFIPFGGLAVAALLFPFFRKKTGFREIYLTSTLGYATHALLDACTSYGTRLLWPFSDLRVAWDNVSVIDPIVTLVLLACVAGAAVAKATRFARVGLLLTVLYLLFGVAQRDRAEAFLAGVARERGHSFTRMTTKPTIGNLLLWRGIYEHGGRFYVDAVRLVPFSEPRLYEGGSAPKIVPEVDFAALPRESVKYRDLLRFQHFSDDYLAPHPNLPNVIGDVRYAMDPRDMTPLWGIEMGTGTDDGHVQFNTYRDVSKATRAAFFAMLAGGEIPENDKP